MSSGLKFGDALEAMKRDHKARRKDWRNKGMLVFLAHKTTRIPYWVLEMEDGVRVPWEMGTADMLAEDWEIVE